MFAFSIELKAETIDKIRETTGTAPVSDVFVSATCNVG
jgi:hypothetical protein